MNHKKSNCFLIFFLSFFLLKHKESIHCSTPEQTSKEAYIYSIELAIRPATINSDLQEVIEEKHFYALPLILQDTIYNIKEQHTHRAGLLIPKYDPEISYQREQIIKNLHLYIQTDGDSKKLKEVINQQVDCLQKTDATPQQILNLIHEQKQKQPRQLRIKRSIKLDEDTKLPYKELKSLSCKDFSKYIDERPDHKEYK